MVMNQRDNHHRVRFVSLRISLLLDFVVEVGLRLGSDCSNVYHRVAMVMHPKDSYLRMVNKTKKIEDILTCDIGR